MSDIDKDSFRNEERQKLVNNSDNEATQVDKVAKAKKKKIIFGLIGLLILIGVILAIVLPLTLKSSDDSGSGVLSTQEFNPFKIDPTYNKFSVFKGELVINTTKPLPLPTVKYDEEGKLFMSSEASGVKNTDYKPVNPDDIPTAFTNVDNKNNVGTDKVQMNIDMVDNFDVRLFFRDFNVPPTDKMVSQEVFPRPVLSWESRLTQVGFETSSDPFSFSFSNIYTKKTILTTEKRKLFISDKFSEIGFVLPSQRCYGLGQRNGQFVVDQGTYTLHSRFRERGLETDDGLGDKSGNHIQPFIMCQTQDKDFIGMFFVSNFPQSFEILKFGSDKRMVLNYIVMGGPIEIYTIMRGKADEIIQKYQSMIGYSAMPPYHALGFYQGSNTYSALQNVKDVINGFSGPGVALEGLFIDNYNKGPHQTFTVSDNFKGIQDYIKSLQAGNQRVVLGASMAFDQNSDAFKAAQAKKCLVMTFNTDKELIGILDKTKISYIDPFNANAQPFFEQSLPAFYTLVGGFDGIQIQDSYLPNHISGEVVPKKLARELSGENSMGTYEPYTINDDQTFYSLYNLPYVPFKSSIDYMTISPNATQGGGGEAPTTRSMFVKNANGHRTLQKMSSSWSKIDAVKNRRSLLFTDSTWSGSGAYGISLITDMSRTWINLRGLIAQAMSLSLAGQSNFMVDGCGSLGQLDEELCARWMQVAAFMPMYRGYYNATYLDDNSVQQKTDPSEFYNFKSFDWQTTYTSAIAQRLPFTRYLYSQLYYAYRVGAAIVHPMFYDFPEDDFAFQNVEQTYMLGDSLKISPVLDQGKKDGDQYKSYFPSGLWYDLNDPKTVINTTAKGGQQTLTVSNTHTNVHLKGGKIIPYQANTQNFKTTRDFETQLRMSFKIARDSALKYADGYVLIDDGISADSYAVPPDGSSAQKFTFWKLRYAEKSINFWVEYGDFQYEPPAEYQIHYLSQIDILQGADLKDTDFACFLGLNLQPVNLDFSYNEYSNVFTLKPTKATPNIKFNEIGFIKFGSSKNGDQNFCDATSFQYNTDSSDTKTNPHQWVYNISSTQKSLKPLIATFTQLDDIGTLNLEITTIEDFNAGKTIIYRVPDKIVYDTSSFPDQKDLKKNLDDFLIVTEKPFSYSIYKDAKDPTTKVWSSDPNRLQMTEFFVMDSGIFDMNPDVDQPLLGMGERAGSIFYKNEQGGIHSRYTFDQANPIDDGLPPGRNMYGYQPFYAFQSAIKTTNDWFGVFDVSSYATDYILFSQNADKHTQIHKITIGGTINKFFFIGAKPDDVIKTYSQLVGHPTVPPLWSFGWHQCRFGWVTEDDWWDVYQQYKKNDLPLDTMWADIDYMDDYKLFTISKQSYPNLAEKVDQIKADGLTFVPIMDAGVAVRLNQGYKALDDGIKGDVFIKQANQKDYLTAGVWCGNAYFPDFFKPATIAWWKNSFEDLYSAQGLHFDGIWLDENEATNFCNGYCKPEERPADSYRNKPFYVPGWRDLEDKALGVDGWHDSIKRREYDVHNLFPLMQTKATAEFLISQKKRPYILTRSNFPGIGKYGHHWMGDNWSTIDYMKLSVDGIFSYNLFALPFMGSDICGFNGDAAPDLCTRWHILGSLYPFARNHNQNASASQEPYRFNQTVPGTDKEYLDIIRDALITRYSFIKYYYTSFYNFYLEGGSFFKPLFYEYPQDPKAFIDVEVNILLGDAMKLSMETTTLDFVTYPKRQYYFPADRWCQIFPALTDPKKECFNSPGGANGYLTLDSNLEAYYIHLRNGYILPYQDAMKNKVRKTLDLKKYMTDLWILPLTANDPAQSTPSVAHGNLIFDDGVSALPAPYAKFEFYLVKNADGKTYQMQVKNTGTLTTKGDMPGVDENLGNIYIMWVSETLTYEVSTPKHGVKKVKAAISTAKITTSDGKTATVNISIDANTDIATIPISDGTNNFMFWDIVTIDIQ